MYDLASKTARVRVRIMAGLRVSTVTVRVVIVRNKDRVIVLDCD